MKTICLTVGPLASNRYLLKDEASGEGVVIDPGGDADEIVETCRREGLDPVYIVNTHAHADHIGANAAVAAAFPSAVLCIGHGDAALLQEGVANLSALLGLEADTPEPDRLLHEDEQVRFGSCSLAVMETPGHTPGGICLAAQQEQPIVVFCGDLIFRAGVGRTDLPGGSMAALQRSIEERIFALPADTILLPGHGEATTVAAEKMP